MSGDDASPVPSDAAPDTAATHSGAPDPWKRFTDVSRARINLGRSGDALPTRHALRFEHAHALARDAVTAAVDFEAIAAALAPMPCVRVHSRAADRSVYLRRPDLGRLLDAPSAARLGGGPFDAVFVIADGLSASAVQGHAAAMLAAARQRLAGWRLGPVVLAEQSRVALGDAVGAALQAELVVVLIGERPGLSVPNSLGIYLTYAPRPGRRDSERNCISNVHADGLSYARAADKLVWLMQRARSLQLTGVMLKEEAPHDSALVQGDAVAFATEQKNLDSDTR